MQAPEQQPETAEPQDAPTITRSVDLDADLQSVWEAVSTGEGRERWLEPDPDRVLIVEREQPPTRISWWWWSAEEPASHVDLRVVAIPIGTRVIVTETAPARLPLATMAASVAGLGSAHAALVLA